MQSKRMIYTLCITAVLIALYCYNPFVLYFQNDDFIHIPQSARGILLQNNSFRPICDLSIQLDYLIWGKTAWGYHLTNLLLHIINSVLVFLFTRKILLRFLNVSDTVIAFTVSVLFFIYSMHTEAVLWILGRSAMLGALFTLLTLYFFIHEKRNAPTNTATILFFILSLFSYESAWVVPLYCFVLAIPLSKKYPLQKKQLMILVITEIAVFIVYLFLRFHFIHEIIGAYEDEGLHSNWLLAGRNYLILFTRNFLPAFINSPFLLAGFVIATLAGIYFYIKASSTNKKQFLFFVILFLISLLPYITLGVDTNGTESERFLYMPAIFVCTMLSLLLLQSKVFYLSKETWLLLIIICHLITLYNTKDNYIEAGKITAAIENAIDSLPPQKIIVAKQLPQSQNGAFIFRQGFKEMVYWKTEQKPDTVIVESLRSELKPVHFPYVVKYVYKSNDTCVMEFADSSFTVTK